MKPKRGIIKIKPVFIGIYHYEYSYGSVCSPDVRGTPHTPSLPEKELLKRAENMVQEFKENIRLDFVKVEEPFLVRKQSDLRTFSSKLTYDVDAILVGTLGCAPLELRTLRLYGIPLIGSRVSEEYLRALRVKKYLRESRFLYIGEIPSFSAPNGPWDFYEIEKKLGIRAKHIDMSEFFRFFNSIPDSQAKRTLEEWRKDFAGVVEPSEEELLDSAKIYLTLRYLCEKEDANAVTINCGRFTEESAFYCNRPIVPCMAFNRLIDEGIMCACEGDITATISALILHAVSEQPVLMGNFGYRPGMFEAREDEVTIEHDIIPLSMATTKYRVRDYHGRKFGVTAYADIKKQQPITLLNVDTSLERMTVIEGWTKYSVDGGHCRIIIHIDVKGDVNKIPEILVGSQHISMTYGHWLKALVETGKLLGIEVLHFK
ncbi:MAG: hypothetical protein DRJ52_03560 [Thermoprotei archaeon]|nr:MAG: hypothetical protein DRJ52_03560 [Thermoprotei archaeon]RLE98985.1 MAG: hypothetical protein DRJ63_06630 [Thermoprotei archaeon]HDI75593.1 hypothetical protein [Thermoprotei archaeon]